MIHDIVIEYLHQWHVSQMLTLIDKMDENDYLATI